MYSQDQPEKFETTADTVVTEETVYDASKVHPAEETDSAEAVGALVQPIEPNAYDDDLGDKVQADFDAEETNKKEEPHE